MRVIIIAAIAPGGVIGRTKKPCPQCTATNEDGFGTPTPCDECGGLRSVSSNDLPWGREYPEDLKRFQAATMGKPVIMGSRSAESMGAAFPLRGRDNLVVTRSLPHGASFHTCTEDQRFYAKYGSIETALDACKRDAVAEACIVGGAEIYRRALPLADELDLTLISRAWEGDVLFPGSAVIACPWHDHDRIEVDVPSSPVFECVERRAPPGDHPDLTFTQWVRHA